MTGHNADFTHRIADSIPVTAWSRLAMLATPVLFTALASLSLIYFDGVVADFNSDVIAVNVKVAALDATVIRETDKRVDIEKRVTVAEDRGERQRSDSADFQSMMLGEIREMRSTIVTLSNRVSALDATIQAMRDRASLTTVPRELSTQR